jgi:hypothetical protein
MSTQGDFNQAFQSFTRRENLPAALTSEEWSSVPAEIRERAFFMSRVTDAEILQRFREGADDVIAGRKGLTTVEKEISFWLRDQGYRAPAGKEGTLQDLSSLPRIMVVLRTNMEMARGHAAWVQQQTSIRTYPAQEFLRVSPRQEPRDWAARWAEAWAETRATPGVHPTRRIALLNHPIWRKLSRFDQPYPPFDFGSGMGVRAVSRGEALDLGFELDPNNDPMQQPMYRSLNDGLEATPQISDPVMKAALQDRLGRFGEWDGGKVVFTDPDGTKKYPAAKLVELWAKPAPAGYEAITQKQALEEWSGGLIPDPSSARVILRRLFDRIETAPVDRPAELWRVIRLGAADVVDLVRGLARKALRIPPNVAGWDWAATPQEAARMAGDIGTGWKVAIRLEGITKAIDIRALRPGKPGFVYVGGTEFRVADFRQDVATRLVSITLREA